LFEKFATVMFAPRCDSGVIGCSVTGICPGILPVGVQDRQYGFQHQPWVTRHIGAMLSVFRNQVIVYRDGISSS
jgi:hypothetical protein